MVKNWAESSDDDSDYDDVCVVPPSSMSELKSEPGAEPEPEHSAPPIPKKEFKWPTEPPFTAYVGNLAFSIKDPDELSERVVHLVKANLGKDIRIVRARIALDRQQNSRPKGFGYVELETLEELKTLMELANETHQLAGRPVRLDVAAPPRVSSFRSRSSSGFGSVGEIDGSKFQAGKYSRQGSGSFRRQNSGSGDRPSLKLKPRSSDLGGGGRVEKSSSGIFGEGKARDGTGWRSQRLLETERSRGGQSGNTSDLRRSSSKSDNNNNNKELRRPKSKGDGKQQHKNSGDLSEMKKPQMERNELASKEKEVDAAPDAKKVPNKFGALHFPDSEEE